MGLELQTCYRYDEDGYFVGNVQCQVDAKDGLMLAADAVEVAPDVELLATHFMKWDGSKWLAEKKPTTPEECAALGDLPHEKQTERIHELRTIFEKLCEGSKEWRCIQDKETLAKRVVPIPPEEEEAAEADRELSEFDAQINALKDRMSLAMLQGDDDEVAALRSEYMSLMS